MESASSHNRQRGSEMTWYIDKTMFWFRLKSGKGFSIAYKRPVFFSERYGYRKVYRLGNFSFMTLEASQC